MFIIYLLLVSPAYSAPQSAYTKIETIFENLPEKLQKEPALEKKKQDIEQFLELVRKTQDSKHPESVALYLELLGNALENIPLDKSLGKDDCRKLRVEIEASYPEKSSPDEKVFDTNTLLAIFDQVQDCRPSAGL